MKITGYNNNNKPCLWLDSIADGQQYLAEKQYFEEGKEHFNTLQKIFDCAFGSVQGLQYIVAGKKVLHYNNGFIITSVYDKSYPYYKGAFISKIKR
jgi:hypothetical protein